MKKIKAYFERHPKLRKIGKLLGVVAIVLSFVFNGVIIATAIIQANQPKTTQVLAYGDFNNKPQDKGLIYVPYNGSYFISSEDFGFEIFYRNAIDMFGEGFAYGTDTTYSLSSNNGDFSLGSCDYCVFDQETLEFNTYLDITNVQITKTLKSFPGYDYKATWYQISIHITGGYRYFINYFVYRDVKYYNVDLQGGLVVNEYHFSDGNTDSFVVRDKYFQIWDTESIFYKLFIQGYDKGYTTGYWEGYALGRNDGIDYGYTQGYDQGFEDGSLGQFDSNPFALIGQAFSAVASILNIEVLPNLTLGVLVFTPLIVTIIIVVVKFIRG